jgi:16S rRNA (guanine966-N2)-methyltransferase
MRILAGRWAGTDLAAPSGRVRPTAEEVRDAWLREIADDLPGARLLELYAGTGALGLEALSRGAAACDFVENSPSALHALKANIAATRSRRLTRVFKRDALHFIGQLRPGQYDIAFADPPYQSRQLDRLVEAWHHLPFSRILTVEHATDHALPRTDKTLVFAETSVTTFRLAELDNL